jgi:hypothetical protein
MKDQKIKFCGGIGQFHTNETGAINPKPYLKIDINSVLSLIDSPQQVDKSQGQWLIPSIYPSRSFKEQEQHGKYHMLWVDLDENPPAPSVLAGILKDTLDDCDLEIYSSKSATPDNKKCRGLIPLSGWLDYADWTMAQQILNDKLHTLGIVPDRASERAAQLCYLPNRGAFYESSSKRNGRFFNPLLTWGEDIAAKQAELEAKQAELEAARSAAKARREALSLTDCPNIYEAFNRAFTPQDWLTNYGYDQRGNNFRHPNSKSGNHSASVRRDDNGILRVNTLSPADPLYSTEGAHDAFSVFCTLFHNGDRNAALKEAGDNLLSIGSVSFNKALQIQYAKDREAIRQQARASEAVNYGAANDSGAIPDDFGHEKVTAHNEKIQQRKERAEQAKAGVKAKWELELERHVEKWNQTNASVILGGRHKIMRFIPAAATPTGRDSYEFVSRHELNLAYANTSIKTGEKELKSGVKDIFKTHVMAWAEDYRSRSYRGGVVFLPGKKTPDDYFNTWQGFAVEPEKGDWSLIQDHIENVICDNDPELIEYFYNWVAFTFQRPDEQAGAALVCRGGKGSGKGTIGSFLMNIWGAHAMHISSSKHLTGNFNGHLADTCFLFSDEATFAGDKQGEGVLKAMITEHVITVERKGIDAIQQPNYLKVFMATNHDWAVPATRDERRYCVFDVSPARTGDKPYFDALHKAKQSKTVQAAFLFDMLARDISDFHTGQIPDTIGLRAQRMESLSSAGKWLVDSLSNGFFDRGTGLDVDDVWNPEPKAKELFDSYAYWCNSQKVGEYSRLTQTGLGSYLADIGFPTIKRSVIYRTMGALDEAIEKFEAHEKVKIPTVP